MRIKAGQLGNSRWRRLTVIAVLAFGLTTMARLVTAAGLGPDSPEVGKAIDRGLQFLETGGEKEARMGGHALVGLAMIKHGANREHPLVQRAVATIRNTLGDRNPDKLSFREIYGPGLATIFLIEHDPSTYRPEIECLLECLRRAQKPHGGWGYGDRETGDTSMVQYAVLAFWEAKHAGFKVEQPMIEGITEWLLRTQDPSGGFGYQGKVSTSLGQSVPQDSVRLSLTAAGLGSLYICADMLGLSQQAPQREEGVPAALQEVRDGQPALRQPKTSIDPKLIVAAQRRGNQWMAKNFDIAPKQWTHYYLYALERYMSFREAAEGPDSHRIPWYHQGASFLTKNQEEPGSWTGQGQATVDTAFSLLFLMRSMRKSIDKAQGLGAGLLVGGRGLPKDTERVEVRRGRVVSRPLAGPAEELLAMLDDPDLDDDDGAIEQLADLTPEEAHKIFGTRPDRLRQLARGASPQARMTAIQTLAHGRDLEIVPILIHALDDPDAAVTRAARDGLRRLARKPAGFGLPDAPTPAERADAIRRWKAWYRAVCPDAVFEN
ncbi:MAG: hypothetical protein U1E05_21440 [Patescibacteria group bacterium]|nr:hypothetical protein [Patescibacteria group bacterium]